MIYTFVAMIALGLLRAVSAFFAPFPLQVDEAQYAGWAHDLAAGYYSKPPFIAWALGGGQGVCSVLQIHHVEGCARMLQAPAFLVSGLLVMAAAAVLFADKRVTSFAGLLFLTLPLVGFYSLVATTDAWLMCWWSLALLTFILAQKPEAGYLPWLVCGISIGLGMLTKYSMALFVVSAVIYLLKQKKFFKVRPFAMMLVAFLVFLPNLIWNAQTGFPTLSHHVDISQVAVVEGGGWNFWQAVVELFTFFSAQFVVFGPWAFLSLLVVSLFKSQRPVFPDAIFTNNGGSTNNDRPVQLLLIFVWPMLGLIFLQAFMSRAHSNWAVPAYVAGSILVAAFWVRCWDISLKRYGHYLFGKFALKASIASGLLMTTLMVGAPYWVVAHPALQSSHLNPLRKLQGWKEVALWAKQYTLKYPVRVIAQDRELLADLSSYGYPQTYPPLAWNPTRQHDNHYRWFYDVAKAPDIGDAPMLLILLGHITSPSLPADPLSGKQLPNADISSLQQAFQTVTPIQSPELAKIEIGADHLHAVAYEVRGFKGYH